MEDMEAFDKLKTKVLKYVLYKKRSEAEIRRKFATNEDEIMLDEVIQFLKENNYINDEAFIERTIDEYKRLKCMSIKEIEYKLLSKGIERHLIEDYIFNHEEQLLEYELESAKQIIRKKQTSMNMDDITVYLMKKGYSNDTIKNIEI